MGVRGRRVASACIILLVLGLGARHMWQRYEQRQQAAASTRLFAPLVEKLSNAAVSGVERTSGWEATVETGLALAELARTATDWDTFVAGGTALSFADLRPSLASPILRLLRSMQALHAQERPEHRGATWRLAQELTGSLGTYLQVAGDPQRLTLTIHDDAARKLAAMAAALRHAGVVASPGQRAEVVSALMELLAALPSVVEHWDRGALARDDALLALFADDWASAERAARIALSVDHEDDTAALVAAIASVESATPDTLETVVAQVDRWLDVVERRNPEQPHPAALVRALLARRANDPRARDHFESLVAGWRGQEPPPRRADRFRATNLRPTTRTEAAVIRATWVWGGAALFSPTLQLASFPTESDPVGALRRALLRHVHDRLANGKQALLPADLSFCSRTFGMAFVEAFPQEAFLDLILRQSPDGPRVSVSIRNRSGHGATQASLALLLRPPGGDDNDRQVLTMDRRPALEPFVETAFGDVDLPAAPTLVDGALLVTEDVVALIRTDEARAAELAASRDRRAQAGRSLVDTNLRAALGIPEGRITASLQDFARLDLETPTGVVRVSLPDTVTPLRPAFRLRQGKQEFAPVEHAQADDGWALRFDATRGSRAPPSLRIESRLASFLVTWKTDHDGWVVDTVTELE